MSDNKSCSLLELYTIIGDKRWGLSSLYINYLFNHTDIDFMFLHGSFSRGDADDLSDIDMIVGIKNESYQNVINEFHNLISQDPKDKALLHTEIDRFQWFGHLESISFPEEKWFTLEIGFIMKSELITFYVEPDVLILKDYNDEVIQRCIACRIERITLSKNIFDNLGFELIHLHSKFMKAIKRGHLWNAYNYCTTARRMFFDLKRRERYGENKIFVGNIDRRIELELDEADRRLVSNTAPRYCEKEIINAFLAIFAVLYDCSKKYITLDMQKWIDEWCIIYNKSVT